MPVKDGMGYSKETPRKQRHFAGILKMQLGMARGAMSNPRNRGWCDQSYYQYFDLFSGSGWWIDEKDGSEQKGSPLIFLDIIEKVDIPYRAVFVDIRPENMERLRDSVPAYHLPYCTFVADDGAMAIRPYMKAMTFKHKNSGSKSRMGMVYLDPNKITLVNWDLLRMFNRVEFNRTTDIVIYAGATGAKRVRGSLKSQEYLTDGMSEVNKKKWIVRVPYDKNQWTFLMGTEYIDMKTWEAKGFYDCRSEQGARILQYINYSKDELKELGLLESIDDLRVCDDDDDLHQASLF